jgi:general secretion pathway protein G
MCECSVEGKLPMPKVTAAPVRVPSAGRVHPAFRGRVRRAFTLIEVLIVLFIVLALSAVVGLTLFGRQDDAKVQLAQTDLNTIKSALRMFRFDMGRYPTEDEGISVLWDSELLETEGDVEESPWKGPYLENPIPVDRWGNEWGYRDESEYEQDYDLWSFGPDGEEDTEDDLTSWAGAAGSDEFGDDLMPAMPGGDGP